MHCCISKLSLATRDTTPSRAFPLLQNRTPWLVLAIIRLCLWHILHLFSPLVCFHLIFTTGSSQKEIVVMNKGAFEKMVLQKTKSWGKYEDKNNKSINRILININILGSSGPIRLVVNETDAVSCIIETALKTYAREGRLPVLGSDATNFFLYCPDAGFDALSPSEPIGVYGTRNFVLCKKQASPTKTEAPSKMITHPHKGIGGWKWLNKSLSFRVRSVLHFAPNGRA